MYAYIPHMVSPQRESAETTGLVVIKHSTGLTPQGRARDAAGLPTSAADEGPTEDAFEIREGAPPAEIAAAMRRVAAQAATMGEVSASTVAFLLNQWADNVALCGETVGELLARTGMDEGDRIEIRFPTVAEDRAKLAKLIDAANHATNARPTVVRDANGAPVEPVKWEQWPETEGQEAR